MRWNFFLEGGHSISRLTKGRTLNEAKTEGGGGGGVSNMNPLVFICGVTSSMPEI